MQRVGFLLKVKQDKVEEYKKMHENVWPEMLEALSPKEAEFFKLIIEDQVKLDAELTRLGKSHTFFSYSGAGHAFMDFTNPDRYQQEASEAAWPRTLEFFATHLKGAAVTR